MDQGDFALYVVSDEGQNFRRQIKRIPAKVRSSIGIDMTNFSLTTRAKLLAIILKSCLAMLPSELLANFTPLSLLWAIACEFILHDLLWDRELKKAIESLPNE